MEQRSNEVLLNIVQGTLSNHLRKNVMQDNVRERMYIYIYVCVCVCVCVTGSLCCTAEIEHCKSTIVKTGYNNEDGITHKKKGDDKTCS